MDGADPTSFKEQVEQLAVDLEEARRYTDESRPAWLSLRHPRGEVMQWAWFEYFPAVHYEQALDEYRPETDGGRENLHTGTQRSRVYYWLDPQTGAALYHTGVYADEANPFFGSITDAEIFLEQQADASERYASLSLYEARTRKVRDAKDVLTDQMGIDDFAPDGGRLREAKKADGTAFPVENYLDTDPVYDTDGEVRD